MVLTIAIEGKGVIANADATPDTAMTGSLWNEIGAGTDSFSTDVYLYGNTSFAGQYSSKAGWQYYDIGAGNELDFTPSTGAERDQFIWLWVNIFTLGKIATKANKGLTIRIGSSLVDYKEYVVAGSDDTNSWKGEWKCFIIDPTKANTTGTGAGSPNIASIRYMGFYIDNTAAFLAPSIFMSQIAVGSGLRITGTSTTAWQDVIDYCTNYSSRAWGMFTEKEGIAYAYGTMNIGDATNQAGAVSFADSGKVIQFGTSEYWTGSAWVTSYPIDACGINIEDHTSYTTTFTDGIIVGTDNGRSGSLIIGNENHTVNIDLYGGNNVASVTALYGTTLKSITGTINSGNDTGHKFLGTSFIKCSQFDPVGAPFISNCTFVETVSTEASIKWNASINLQLSKFIANTIGAGIEHDTQGSFGYTDLTFSGNTYDILYSAIASSGVLTINATDSNPGTSEITNPTGNSVSIVNSVDIKVFVKDKDNNPIVDAAVAVYKTSDGTQLMNELSAVTTGLATEPFNYTGDTNVYIRIRKSSTGTRYIPVNTTGQIIDTGLTVTVILNEDINI